MKLVTFTRAMAPFVAGETRLVPNDVAARLEAEGVIAPGAADWPPAAPQEDAPSLPPAARNRLRLPGRRDPLGQAYLTK